MVTPAGPFIVAFNSAATCFASVSDSNSRISPFDVSQDWPEPVTPPLTDAMIRIMRRSRWLFRWASRIRRIPFLRRRSSGPLRASGSVGIWRRARGRLLRWCFVRGVSFRHHSLLLSRNDCKSLSRDGLPLAGWRMSSRPGPESAHGAHVRQGQNALGSGSRVLRIVFQVVGWCHCLLAPRDCLYVTIHRSFAVHDQVNSAMTTKKAAGVESGGGEERYSVGSAFDGVDPLVANLLAGGDQPVLLRQGAARAEHGPGRMFLPFHGGHDLFQRGAARALE